MITIHDTASARLQTAVATLLVAIAGLVAPNPSVAQSASAPAPFLIRSTTVSRVARSRIPSVVFIQVQSVSGDRLAEGIGAGVVIDQSGLIVTNAHVVGEATRLRVEDANGRQFEAEAMGVLHQLDQFKGTASQTGGGSLAARVEKDIHALRQKDQTHCSSCGAQRQPADRFCSRCGARFAKAGAA